MSAPDRLSDPTVAEMQGMCGTYGFPEKLLQKLWLRGQFNRQLATTLNGRRLQILHPGKWNLLGGPDFLNARLRFDGGPVVSGDVEVHLRECDWVAHGHLSDPAYARVILHVVLFPPGDDRTTKRVDGREIPVIALLPLLLRSLEECAADDAVEQLSGRPGGRISEVLGPMPAGEVTRIIFFHSRARWAEKLHFARIRLNRLGWNEACHHTAMEIMGFRSNRAPMVRCASRWTLAEWANGSIGPDEAFASELGSWSLQGSRPANHPRRRLGQYSDWAKQRPEWPEIVRAMSPNFEFGAFQDCDIRKFRRLRELGRLRRRIVSDLCAGVVGGRRMDNLICDGILPLLAVGVGADVHSAWHAWYPGDLPHFLTSGLRQLSSGNRSYSPISHGQAQGLLGWLLGEESNPVVAAN